MFNLYNLITITQALPNDIELIYIEKISNFNKKNLNI